MGQQVKDFWTVILRKTGVIDDLNYKLLLANEEILALKKQLKQTGIKPSAFTSSTPKPLATKCFAKDMEHTNV